MFCQGVDGEALEELQEDDDSVVNPIELDYENNGTNDDDDEEVNVRPYNFLMRRMLVLVLDLHFYLAVKCDGSSRVRHIIFISSQRFPLRVHINREITTREGVSSDISIWQYGL